MERSETGSLRTHYRVVIEYEYIVDSVSYKSQIMSFPDLAWRILNRGWRSKQSVKQIQTKYPINQSVQVYYNPKKPRQSVLKPGIFDINFILMLIIALVVGTFFAFIFGIFRL